MRKKLLSFLALLMAFLALPQAANANVDGGHIFFFEYDRNDKWAESSPAMKFNFDTNSGWQGYFGSWLQDELWYCTAPSGSPIYKFQMLRWKGDKSEQWNYSNSNDNISSYAFKKASSQSNWYDTWVPTTDASDFRTRADGFLQIIGTPGGGWQDNNKLSMKQNSNSKLEYNVEFTAASNEDYYFRPIIGGRQFEPNSTVEVGESGTWLEDHGGQANSYQISNVKAGDTWKITVKLDQSKVYAVKVSSAPVDPRPSALYVYSSSPGWATLKGTFANGDDYTMTATVDMADGEYFMFSTVASLTDESDWGPMFGGDGAYPPSKESGDEDAPCLDKSFKHSDGTGTNKAWKATKNGRYTITLDFATNKATITCEEKTLDHIYLSDNGGSSYYATDYVNGGSYRACAGNEILVKTVYSDNSEKIFTYDASQSKLVEGTTPYTIPEGTYAWVDLKFSKDGLEPQMQIENIYSYVVYVDLKNVASEWTDVKKAVHTWGNIDGNTEMSLLQDNLYKAEFLVPKTSFGTVNCCFFDADASNNWKNQTVDILNVSEGAVYVVQNEKDNTKYKASKAADSLEEYLATLNSLYISKDGGATWSADIVNSKEITFTGLTGSETYLVKANITRDGSTADYIYTLGDGSALVSKTSSNNAFSLGHPEYFEAKLTIGVTGYQPTSVTVSETKNGPSSLTLYTGGWTEPVRKALTTNNHGRTYDLVTFIPKDQYVVVSTAANATGWDNIKTHVGVTMYNHDNTDGSDYAIPYEGAQDIVEATKGTWKTSKAGNYTIHIDFTTMTATFTCVEKDVAKIRLYKGNTVVAQYATTDNPNYFVLNPTELGANYSVDVLYTDDSTSGRYYWGTPFTADGELQTTTTANSNASFGNDVYSTELHVTLSFELTPYQVSTTNTVKNTLTKHESISGNTVTVYTEDKRGAKVYYGISGDNQTITTEGSFDLVAKGSTETSITVSSIANPQITISYKADNITPDKINVVDPDAQHWYLVGQQFGDEYKGDKDRYDCDNKAYEMTELMFRGEHTGIFYFAVNGLYNHHDGGSNYDTYNYFHVHNGTTAYGPSTNFQIYNYDLHISMQDDSKANYRWHGDYYSGTTYITIDTTCEPKEIWLSKSAPTIENPNLPREVRYRSLNVEPRIVRNAESDWSAWTTQPVVYVVGSNVNNNRLVPDWEMRANADYTEFTISNVTLRSDEHFECKACIIYKNKANADYVDFTIAGSDLTDVGNSFDLKLTKDGDSWTASYTCNSKLPSYFGMVGYNMHQLKLGKTPNYYTKFGGNESYNNDGNTSLGWQESFILYGKDDNPMYDLNGQYIYSTVWPPVNPIYFDSEKTVGGTTSHIELSSADLTFTLSAVNYDGQEKQVLTGSQWESNRTAVSATDYAGLNLDDDTKFARYVINNLWLQGAFKVWSGWASQRTDDAGASWSGKNFGYNHLHGAEDTDDEDPKFDNEDGYSISVGQTVDLAENMSNFKFETPTFFKVVEFYVPVNDDGTLVSDTSKAALYTVQSYGSASIQAQATKLAGSEDENNTGEYKIVFANLPSGSTVEGRVVRVMASNDFSQPEDQWAKAGTAADPDNTDDLIMGNNYGTSSSYSEFTKEAEALANGRYRYALIYTIKVPAGTDDGGNPVFDEHTDIVYSNPFTIFTSDYTASIQAMQLLKLTDEGKDLLTARGVSLKASDGSDFVYLTNAKSGRHYLVSASNKVEFIQSSHATAIKSNSDMFDYTSDFYVLGFIGNDYAAAMAPAKAKGDIYDYLTIPNVWIVKGDEITDADCIDANKAVRSVTNIGDNTIMRLYGRLVSSNGNLSTQNFAARLSYWTQTESSTPRVPKGGDDNGSVRPVVPKPYGAKWTYIYSKLTPEEYPNPTIPTNPNDPKTTYISFTIPGDITKNGKPATVFVESENLGPRKLTAEIEFKRPNVSADILHFYDIQYNVTIRNNKGVPLTYWDDTQKQYVDVVDLTFHDTNTYYDQVRKYKFVIDNCHPDPEIYPIFTINYTDFVENSHGVEHEDDYGTLRATQGPANTQIGVPNGFKENKTAAFNGKVILGRQDHEEVALVNKGLNDWMYRGHEDFQNTEADFTGDDETNDSGSLFFVETYVENGNGILTVNTHPFYADPFECYAAYPYIIKHESGHLDHWPAGKDKGSDPHDTVVDGNGKPIDTDPLVGTYIARDFPTAQTVTFRVTPVYIFNHDHEYDSDHITSVLIPTSSSSAPARRQSSEQAQSPIRKNVGNSVDPSSYRKEGSGKMPDVDKLPDPGTVIAASDAKLVAIYGASTAGYTPEDGLVTSVDNISVDNAFDGEAVYYNLQGVRVANPTTGVYIRVCGTTSEKIYIK